MSLIRESISAEPRRERRRGKNGPKALLPSIAIAGVRSSGGPGKGSKLGHDPDKPGKDNT